MACLETTFIVDLLRGNTEVKHLAEQLDETEISLCVAAPTVMEVWCGALLAKFSDAEKRKVAALLQSLEILPLDGKSAIEAGEIEAELNSKNIQIGSEDIMIAAIAKVNGEVLVTRDKDYAQIAGLRISKY